MRKIIKRIADCQDISHADLHEKLKKNNVQYDGILISIDTGIAYLWKT